MNEKQQEAIKTLNNALLIAGPGSGKTFTIINKVDYLIKNNYYKEGDILIISFTNESTLDLKNKIKYNIDIKTFHKLGLDILKDNNISISNNNYLEYIINEYFHSYAKYNHRTNKALKRLLKEISINNLTKLILSFINLYKSNYINIDYLFNLYQKSHFITKDYLRIILEIYQIYNNELSSSGKIDFNDMLIKATIKINNNQHITKYKYIIIDEFQDTSLIRFNLIYSIMKQNNAKLFAVGDDYQSIYRFNGCNLDIFLNIKKYLKDINILYLDYNYRNNQSLINIANNFIMKNKKQIKKNIICLKDNYKPIKIYFYKDIKDLNKLIDSINTHITILGRNNKDKDLFNIKENNKIKYLTIHKSKGLEDDNIIIINLYNNTFPSKIKNHKIIDLIIDKDKYPYEEERRLFYVALTRSKNNVYLFTPYNNYSIFIKELLLHYRKYIEINNY